jgi:hypothetical protein
MIKKLISVRLGKLANLLVNPIKIHGVGFYAQEEI